MSDKRRLIVRKREITIKDGDYAGWSFTAITNPPMRVIEELTTKDAGVTGLIKGLSQILVAPWNFVDEDGNQMPDPSYDSIRELPTDLMEAVTSAYIAETTTLPQN